MATPARRLFAERHVDPGALALPTGFTAEVAALGLSSPSGVEGDEEGNIYVTEMHSTVQGYGGRVVRVRPDGSSEVVADDFVGPLTGIQYYEGAFYVIESNHPSRVYRLYEDGTRQVLVNDIPGGGDHLTSDIVLAHSERLYFGQGTRTNSGVVGPDNAWLTEYPELCDIPGRPVKLAGVNYETDNVFGPAKMRTGAFKVYGVETSEGETLDGSDLCTGCILRVETDTGDAEVFAWGLRNPTGLSVHEDGRIFCTDTGMQDRGSRPVADGWEYLWQLVDGGWYGWPDFTGGEPVTDPGFKPADGEQPQFLLAEHPPVAARPVLRMPPGTGMAKFEFARSPLFGHNETAFMALTGSLDPDASDSPHGFRVVKIDVQSGEAEDFITNRHDGPASAKQSVGFEHPIAVRFDRTGEFLYVLDLGITVRGPNGRIRTLPNTGVLWRISPSVISFASEGPTVK